MVIDWYEEVQRTCLSHSPRASLEDCRRDELRAGSGQSTDGQHRSVYGQSWGIGVCVLWPDCVGMEAVAPT